MIREMPIMVGAFINYCPGNANYVRGNANYVRGNDNYARGNDNYCSLSMDNMKINTRSLSTV